MLNIDSYFCVDLEPTDLDNASQESRALFFSRGTARPALRIDSLGKRFTIVRLGPYEAWIRLSGASVDVNRALEVWVEGGDQVIGPIRATPTQLPVGLRDRPWLALRLATNRQRSIEIAGLLARLASLGAAPIEGAEVEERETIDDPDRVAAITTSLLRGARPAVLLDGDRSRPCWGRAEGALRIVWHVEGANVPEGPIAIDAEGYASKYRLVFDEARRSAGQLVTGRPVRVERTRRRRLRRAAPAQSLEIVFTSPLFLDHPSRRKVIDLSHDGLSFSATTRDALFPGLTIDPLTLTRADEAPIRFRAHVRSVRERYDDATVVGVALEPASIEDETRWVHFASKQLGPSTEIGGAWDGSAWDVFARSGYFGLSGKSPDDFETMRTALARTSQRLSQAPQLSCQSVWRSERGVEATVWTLRAYQSTWLGHQLAKLPSKERPAQILREIYLHIWETAAASRARWLLCYQEAHIKWVQQVHLDFARPYEPSGRAAVLPFRLTETDTDAGADASETSDDDEKITVRPATAVERGALWDHIARTKPRPYVEALDFVPARADLQELTERWRAVELERSRTVYVASFEGRVVAASVVETAEEGTNLFRILDGVRLFELAAGGGVTFRALLESARSHYRERGKPSFVYYMEEERPDLMSAARLRDLGEGYIWILSGDLIPEFLEHTCQYTWARDPKARKDRAS